MVQVIIVVRQTMARACGWGGVASVAVDAVVHPMEVQKVGKGER